MADPVFVDDTTPLNAVNMNKLQTRDEKAAANGYASLGSDGKVPVAQLPAVVQYGTSLPASPVDGQEAILVDSLTDPTYQWRFRYNAGSSSAYKWEFVGGAPAYREVMTAESTTSEGTAVDLATPGPLFVVPRSGEYDVEARALVGAGTAPDWTWGNTGVYDNAALTSINPLGFVHPVSTYDTAVDESRIVVLAGHTLKLMYWKQSGPAGTVVFLQRKLLVTPVRVA